MTDPTAPGIVWFRRDLRVHDHEALTDALAAHRAVVALYVLDEGLLRGRFASPNRTWHLLGALAALDASLRDRGSRLHVRVGSPAEVVPAVARQVAASAVYVSRDHAPYGRARDEEVAGRLARSGLRLHVRRGVLIHEPEEVLRADGAPFSVFSPFRRAWLARPCRPVLPAPDRIASPADGLLDPGRIPTLAELGLGPGPTADPELLLRPGEPAARQRIDRWMGGPIETYDRSRDRLDDTGGTSRLSVDLHLGSVSALEVAARTSETAEAGGELTGGEPTGRGRRSFLGELIWREFYAHVLFHRPEVRDAAFRPDAEGLAASPDQHALEAWREGQTGYPVVDASMRQLAATGWMHNRGRMVTASFLTKHLLQDWRAGEAHFMRHLVDGDVASNNGGWQWSASTGTDPQPFFRIFNPVLQGQRFDPDDAFVRHWLPELANVPTASIHAPWQLSPDAQAAAGCRLGVDYPAPIVDHREARARVLAAYASLRGVARSASASRSGSSRRTS